MGEFGVIVQGHVTLLGNSMDSMYTGWRSAIDDEYPNMKKTSGIQKGVMAAEMETYVLGREDFKPTSKRFGCNEALLDNWEVVSLFCDKNYVEEMKKIRDKYEYETFNYLSIKHPGAYV